MILTLRQRHRRVFAVLGVLLPVAFVIGIAARKPVPTQTAPGLLTELRSSETEVWNRSDIFPKIPVGVRLLRGPMSSFYRVAFSPDRAFAKPDLLVYWVSGETKVTDVLPDNARLLGSFSPEMSLQLPTEAGQMSGALVMYSLADQEVVDVSKPIRLTDSTK